MTGLGPTPFGPVLIVGTGMMGSSMGRLIRREYPMASVFGLDRNRAVAVAAAEAGHITDGFGIDRLQRLLSESGLVILATPVEDIEALIPVVDARCRTGTMVLDLGSCKDRICQIAGKQPRIRSGEVGFVGGHPMAGSVHSGVEAASEGRLRGAPFFYCPIGGAPYDRIETLARFLSQLDFQPIRVQPKQHDRLVAAMSHAPHLVAVALARWIGGKAEAERIAVPLHYRAAGRGLGVMTAKAAASPALWSGIIESNRIPVARSLRELAASLAQLAERVESGDRGAIERVLEEGQSCRARLESLGFGIVSKGEGSAE